MARIELGVTAAAAGVSDIVADASVTMTADDWLDVYSVGGLNTGIQLAGLNTVGDGVDVAFGNGTAGGAYYTTTQITGDFLIVADLAIYGAADYNTNLLINACLGFGAGVEITPDTDHDWWGAGINSLATNAPDNTLEFRRHSATLGQAWTGSVFRQGFNGGRGLTQARLYIQRETTTITSGFIENGARVQLDTIAGTADPGYVFVWGQTTATGRVAHIKNLAISGLEFSGSQLIASA